MAIHHDDNGSEKHLERSGRLTPAPGDSETQRRRMLIALGVLLLALGAVIVKDWDFWFPSQYDTPEVAARKAKLVPELAEEQEQAPATREHRAARPAGTSEPPGATDSPSVAPPQRTVLPPMQVEVVAGNQRVSVAGKNPAIRVDVGTGATAYGGGGSATGSGGAAGSGMGGGGTLTADGRVELSPQMRDRLQVAVPPDYPLLARQMKVQGAVSLQALIARDGTIQELQIMSGPEILSTAAREAVKQWHFKPYLQGGQAVETQAQITVNFTISTN